VRSSWPNVGSACSKLEVVAVSAITGILPWVHIIGIATPAHAMPSVRLEMKTMSLQEERLGILDSAMNELRELHGIQNLVIGKGLTEMRKRRVMDVIWPIEYRERCDWLVVRIIPASLLVSTVAGMCLAQGDVQGILMLEVWTTMSMPTSPFSGLLYLELSDLLFGSFCEDFVEGSVGRNGEIIQLHELRSETPDRCCYLWVSLQNRSRVRNLSGHNLPTFLCGIPRAEERITRVRLSSLD